MNDLLLEINDLRVHFMTDEGAVRAVDGVDLTVYRGRTLCVVGESGCGKSVTARAILQIVHRPGRILGGSIVYHRSRPDGSTDPVDIVTLDPKGRAIRQIRGGEIAMIFQEPMTSLSVHYTIGDQIGEAVRLHNNVSKQEARSRAVELLRRVRIPRPERLVDEYPFRLSGGMRQRAMIAMALACGPSLLIADEPTTALDVTTQAQILDLMLDLQREDGMGIIFITHDLGVVAEIADDVAVMYLGNVVEYADVFTIFNAPKHPYTQALLRSIPKIAPTREPLDPIAAMVPSPFKRPKGCSFHPRCIQSIAGRCNVTTPIPIVVGHGHSASCLLYSEQAAPAEVIL